MEYSPSCSSSRSALSFHVASGNPNIFRNIFTVPGPPSNSCQVGVGKIVRLTSSPVTTFSITGPLLMYSTGKSAALDSAALNTLRRLVMMLGTADELAAAFVEAPTLAGRAA